MNILRKITLGLVISLLAVGSASAALTDAQKAKVTRLLAAGATPTEVLAELETPTDGGQPLVINTSDLPTVTSTVADIVALLPPAQVAAFTQVISQTIVAQAAAAGVANPNNVGQVARAVAAGASAGAVTAALAAPNADATTVAAAASAASSGSSAGTVAAISLSGKPALVNTVLPLVNSLATASATSATAALGTSTIIAPAALSTASTQGSTAGAVAGATASPNISVAAVTTGPGVVQSGTTGETTTITPPVDNVAPTVFTTFTLVLSYGSFAVTVNNQNDLVTVTPVTAPIGTQVNSNGGSVTELTLPVPDDVNLSTTLLANLDAALTAAATTANGGTVVVTVPGGTITVSPSS